MSNRAPDNMPTNTIIDFIDNARKDRDEWAKDIERLEERLEAHREAYRRSVERVKEYRQWLVTRTMEELV